MSFQYQNKTKEFKKIKPIIKDDFVCMKYPGQGNS